MGWLDAYNGAGDDDGAPPGRARARAAAGKIKKSLLRAPLPRPSGAPA
jgi:hypothetical protein